MTKKRPAKLARASAYWRLARKAERAQNYRQAKIYRDTADRLHRDYLRDIEALQRISSRNH